VAEIDHSQNRPPTAYARDVFDRCVAALEMEPGSIELYANDLVGQHAVGMAAFIGKRRIVLYRPASMARLEVSTRKGWGGVKVMAHEVGHHLWYMRHGWDQSSWERELGADYYAGVALARLGAGTIDLDDYFAWAFYADGTDKHPDTVLRMRALRRGWIDGGGKGAPETDLDKLYAMYWERMTRWWPDDHPEHPKFKRSKK